jgi:hypothetical protein
VPRPTAGRGWSATIGDGASVTTTGAFDTLTLPLANGSSAECRVFIERPRSLPAEIAALVPGESESSMEVAYVFAVDSQPLLKLKLGVRDFQASNGWSRRTLVDLYDDLEHPILCKHDGQEDVAYSRITQKFFESIEWDTEPQALEFSEVHRKSARLATFIKARLSETVVMGDGVKYKDVAYGYRRTYATQGSIPGTLRVVDHTLSFPTRVFLKDAIETHDTETVDAAGNLVAFERRTVGLGSDESKLSLKRENGSCRYEKQAATGKKAGAFRCGPTLSSSLAKVARLKEAVATGAPFSFSLVEYLPDLALDRTSTVRYFRLAGDPENVARISVGKVEVVAEVARDGRFLQTETTEPHGFAATRRVASTSEKPKRRDEPGRRLPASTITEAKANELPPGTPRPKRVHATIAPIATNRTGPIGPSGALPPARKAFQACYDRAFARDWTVRGGLNLELFLRPDGTVARVEQKPERLPNTPQRLTPELTQCAVKVAEGMTFPVKEGTGEPTVTLAISFLPEHVFPERSKPTTTPPATSTPNRKRTQL